MDNQFTLSNMQYGSGMQSTILESLIIPSNGVQNVQKPDQRQQVVKNSNVLDQNNIIQSTQVSKQLNRGKNPTQVVEEEDYINAQSVYGIKPLPQPNDSKIFDKFDGVPDVIDINTIAYKYLKCVQLKLVQDKKIQQKKNLPDQIYESQGDLEVTIGRSKQQNEIVLSDDLSSISSSHAVLYWKEEKSAWFLNDKGSTHGSFLVIDNSPIKEKDKIAIGLYMCTIETIKLDLTKNQFRLSFKCMVDDTIEPFIVEKQVQFSEKLMIGKSHQPQLKDDPMIANNQCYIQYSKEKNKIKIWNCEEAEFKIAKIIQPGKSVKVKNNDLIRFGLVNYYIFSSFVRKVVCDLVLNGKKSSNHDGEECCICSEHVKNIYILNPCNHSGICLECVLQLEQKQKCPICQAHFKDYIVKI